MIEMLNSVNTDEELEALNIGRLKYDLSHRGGNVGFSCKDVARKFDMPAELLPEYVGAYCNYLGGGLRGSINHSSWSSKATAEQAELLYALCEACKRVYLYLEGEAGIPDDVEEGYARIDQKSAY